MKLYEIESSCKVMMKSNSNPSIQMINKVNWNKTEWIILMSHLFIDLNLS